MDRFYLQNATLYQKLTSSFDATEPTAHFSRHKAAAPAAPILPVVKEQNNPNMVIGARIRPMLEEDLTAGFPRAVFPQARREDQAQMVHLHDLYNHPRGRPILKVDRLFDSDATTEDIYADLVVELVAFAKNGGIGTLFAYGQTGSGKTFTISRLQRIATTALIDDASKSDDSLEIYLTISDLAGNSAFDLLDARKPISVLEDSSGTTHLAGATEHRVRTKEEVLHFIDQASSFRPTESTLRNDTSSRSHSICRVRIKNPSAPREGYLYLVDLAGSEAARDIAEHGADRMRETREINMSLSVLKDCVRGKAEVEAMRQKGGRQKKVHIPVRQSTLTKVLKHVFDVQDERECKTVVIACVNPSLADVAPSKNTLRYAEMLRVPVVSAGR